MKIAKRIRSKIFFISVYLISFHFILVTTSISSPHSNWLSFDDSTAQEAPEVTLIESDLEETSFSVHFFGAQSIDIQEDGSDIDGFRQKIVELQKTGQKSVEDVASLVGLDISTKEFWNSSLDVIVKEIDLFLELTK